MMAAMMLPSSTRAGRAVAEVSARTDARWAGPAPAAFAIGYLAVWLMVGLAGAGVLATGRAVGVHPGGRAVAAGVLLAAALYELTPVKDACLRRCRHPVGLVVTHWRPGPLGAVRIGALYGRWCVGCCWALMASFFALGIMSAVWMAIVAGLIAIEKTLPWRRVATYGTAGILLALGVLLFAVPDAVPGLTIPGGGMMSPMNQMSP